MENVGDDAGGTGLFVLFERRIDALAQENQGKQARYSQAQGPKVHRFRSFYR